MEMAESGTTLHDSPTNMRCRPHLILLLLPFPACDSLEHLNGGTGRAGGQDLVPPGSTATPGDPLTTIARLEDARDDGGGLLEILADADGPEVRERAVLALGRLPLSANGTLVTRSLVSALGDKAAAVRSAAAFGLGLRADPAAADGVLDHWRDPEPHVRACLITAAGRIDDDRLRAKVLSSMRSPLSELRQAAVLAPHSWGVDQDVDLALAEVAARLPQGDERAARLEIPSAGLEEPSVLWRALFSLSRRKAEAGRDAFHVHRLDKDPLARLFSVKGLARITPHEAGRLALQESLLDEDWRVVVEAAAGLGSYGDNRSLDSLELALKHPSVHVRVVVAEALSRYEVESARTSSLLASLREDPRPSVRATALVGEATLQGALVGDRIESALRAEDPVLRGGGALAAGQLPTGEALRLLLSATQDPHPRVAAMAIGSLGDCDSEVAHARLRELLSHPDNGLRVAAATALEARSSPGDLPALLACFETAKGDVAVDVLVQVLRTAAALGTEEGGAFVRRARDHSHPWVRTVATQLMPEEGSPVGRRPLDTARSEEPALPKAHGLPGERPRVAVQTTRGQMVFELFPCEAPVHVHSFLSLVDRGHYDGLDFHRVVANFVIQGGCYRGDGNGTGTWRGQDDSIRHEFTPRAYVRGSLGMPRSTEPDSGGSQFFVTHRPTPHLDGRYTIFGELREGFDVLDAIEVGDRILSIERL